MNSRHRQEVIVAKIIRFGAAALVALLVVGMAAAVSAQEKPKPAQIPLKLDLVLSRYQGAKKISSMPYLLWLTTNEGRTSLRMGVQISVPAGGTNYNLRDIGTNIDCSATTGNEVGVYRLNLTVSDSGISATDNQQQAADPSRPPVFRTFTSTFYILLRDGQTGLYTSATDPVSGEVLKIEATLNVLK